MQNKYWVSVEGRDVYSFLKRIKDKEIELEQIEYISIHKMKILLSKQDYLRLKKIKTSYEIKIEKVKGREEVKNFFHKHIIFLISLLISSFFLYFLSIRITEVEVIHSDSSLRLLLQDALKKADIKEHAFVKSYDQIERIKKEILENYKEQLEWIEIKRVGTKYVVRVEERILPEEKENRDPTNIVSNSYAIIKKIEASHGDIIKNIEDYVRPGDVLISGEIKLNEEVKETIHAQGEVYGEVWYHTTVEYPYVYEEIKETGKKKEVYTLTFLGKRIEFTKDHYVEKKIDSKTILKHNLLPISFTKEKQTEVIVIKQNLTKEEAEKKALEEIEKKIKETLTEKEYIISIKKLKVEENQSKIILEAFASVYKNIGVSEKIVKLEEENKE